MNMEIKVGIGLGDITFGSSKSNVKNIIGEPDEIEKLDVPVDDEEILLEQWHYDDMELSVSFELDDNEVLDTIAVSSSDYTINGISIIGKNINEINDLLISLQLGTFEKEDLSDEEEKTIVFRFIENNMNFWFEDDILSEIQWGPVFLNDPPVIFPN